MSSDDLDTAAIRAKHATMANASDEDDYLLPEEQYWLVDTVLALCDALDQTRAELSNAQHGRMDSDRWADHFRVQWQTAEAEVARLRTAIEDIDAHATPLGTDDDGFVTTGYVVTVGAMHRALGVLRGAVPVPTRTEEREEEA